MGSRCGDAQWWVFGFIALVYPGKYHRTFKPPSILAVTPICWAVC